MTNLVVERENLNRMMEEWLGTLGVREGDKVEVTFQADKVIIRPQSAKIAELDAWLDEATRKYDSVLKRLAVS